MSSQKTGERFSCKKNLVRYSGALLRKHAEKQKMLQHRNPNKNGKVSAAGKSLAAVLTFQDSFILWLLENTGRSPSGTVAFHQ